MSRSRNLATQLLNADSQKEVVEILDSCGYWSDNSLWRPLGDIPGNAGTVNNQQSDAFAALTEKLTNSIDEILMQASRVAGCDPESPDAPRSIAEAVTRFGLIPGVSSGPNSSALLEWISRGASNAEQLALARNVCVTVTGPQRGLAPSLTIADLGGGQTPDNFPKTFMSLHRGNKAKVNFVQGRFNMGGTGALRFCGGPHHLQLVISRRNPALATQAVLERDAEWGFTVVRRRRPENGERTAVYEYLAPYGDSDLKGVLSFEADAMPLFPSERDMSAYHRQVQWGTVIKLYEYTWDTSMASRSMAVRGKSVLTQLNCGLPTTALPVRLFDARGYEGHSFANTVIGLRGWLEHQIEGSKLEPECPITGQIQAGGYSFPIRAYVFGDDESSPANYKANFGVIFTVNGQRHGHKEERYFTTKAVGLNKIAKKLVVLVECDALDVAAIDELFMSSRDRLAGTDLTREVEAELTNWLASNEVLKAINNRHIEAELARRLGDNIPLKDVFKKLLTTNPGLADVFMQGSGVSAQSSDEHSGGGGAGRRSDFEPRQFPTYFRFFEREQSHRRKAHKRSRVLIDFETDASNDYFARSQSPGEFQVSFDGGRSGSPTGSLGTLHEGALRFALVLPDDVNIGETLKIRFSVTDMTQLAPFECFLELDIVGEEKRNPTGGTGRRTNPNAGSGQQGGPGGIELPEIEAVSRANWPDDWDENFCLQVIMLDGKPRKFRVNADNKHLLSAIRRKPDESSLLQRKFELGSALLALAVITDGDKSLKFLGEDRGNPTVDEIVAFVTATCAQLLLPLVESLGSLTMGDMEVET